jgi:hypothetical protein
MKKSSDKLTNLTLEQLNLSKTNISNVIYDLLEEYNFTSLSSNVQKELDTIQILENTIKKDHETIQVGYKKYKKVEITVKKRMQYVQQIIDSAKLLLENVENEYKAMQNNNKKFVEVAKWLDVFDELFVRVENTVEGLEDLSSMPSKFDKLKKVVNKKFAKQNIYNTIILVMSFLLIANLSFTVLIALFLKGVI